VIKTLYLYVVIMFYVLFSSRSPNRTASILVFPPGLKIAWQSITLAKILPRPDSCHGSLRMSLVFVQSTRALNSSATLRAVREEHLSDDIYCDQMKETKQRWWSYRNSRLSTIAG
jgi:hypothetical protein